MDARCSDNVDPSTEKLFPLRSKDGSLGIEKCLPMKSLLQLVGDHRGERVSCLKGVIWITQSGNPEDIFVCAGEAFTITQQGTIVVQGMAETRLKIIRLS